MDLRPGAADPRTLRRADFDEVTRVSTRWADNDMFGHLNNAVYHELFDSAINAWMIAGARGRRDAPRPEIGVVAESGVPVPARARLPRAHRRRRSGSLGSGRTSVTYELGLFAASEEEIAAYGEWVHVYIGRESRAAVPIPAADPGLLESAVARRG